MADLNPPVEADDVGLRLRRARQHRGWSLADAAAASSGRFKASTLAAYERGDRRVTAETLYALAQLYATPIAGLFPPSGSGAAAEDALVERIGHLPGPHRDLVSSLVERMLLDTRVTAPPPTEHQG